MQPASFGRHARGACRATAGLWLLLPMFLALNAAVPSKAQPSARAVLRELDAQCKKVVWMTGVQLDTAKLKGHFYGTASNTYQEHLIVALKSISKYAPSLVPFVVFMGERPEDAAVSAVEQQVQHLGAKVVWHDITFKEPLLNLSTQPYWGHISHVMGTFLRVDLPNILPKIASLVDPALVDLDYVLWTDPDVMFLDDINSCTLPKPHILSIGGDTAREVPSSCGVIYYNVSAYKMAFPDLLKFAAEKDWKFWIVDQQMLLEYFGLHRFNLLPDTYNYKPYWGKPPGGVYGPFSKVAILHIQGPKFQGVLCALSKMRTEYTDAQHWKVIQDQVYSSCGVTKEGEGYQRKIIEYAFHTDRGEYYFEAFRLFKHIQGVHNGNMH